MIRKVEGGYIISKDGPGEPADWRAVIDEACDVEQADSQISPEAFTVRVRMIAAMEKMGWTRKRKTRR